MFARIYQIKEIFEKDEHTPKDIEDLLYYIKPEFAGRSGFLLENHNVGPFNISRHAPPGIKLKDVYYILREKSKNGPFGFFPMKEGFEIHVLTGKKDNGKIYKAYKVGCENILDGQNNRIVRII